MRFGSVARSFIVGFRGWDTRSKIAFALAAILLVIILILGGRLPVEYRSSVIIGVIGLLVVAQGIFLYANRNMVTHITQAQRLILDSRYGEAVALLESLGEGLSDSQTLTLLGSTYRMMGRVDDSRQILTKALQMSPKHHFTLYSFGRTLLASGHYAEAVDAFRRSLEHGAPAFARVDLAEAEYRMGDPIELAWSAEYEPHVTLMARYLLWRAGQAEQPENVLVDAGLSYWEKTATRFAHTPYGADLQRDIEVLRGLRSGS